MSDRTSPHGEDLLTRPEKSSVGAVSSRELFPYPVASALSASVRPAERSYYLVDAHPGFVQLAGSFLLVNQRLLAAGR